MGAYPNWKMLEERGLIQPSPGREEAAKAALDHAAAKKEAQREAMQRKSTPARRKRK